MADTPRKVSLSYSVNVSNGSLKLASSLESLSKDGFTPEDVVLFGFGEDVVQTSQGRYRLTRSFADANPPAVYRTYELSPNTPIEITR